MQLKPLENVKTLFGLTNATYFYKVTLKSKQAYVNNQKDRLIDRQIDRQRQVDRQIGRQIDRQIDRYRKIDRWIDRQVDK